MKTKIISLRQLVFKYVLFFTSRVTFCHSKFLSTTSSRSIFCFLLFLIKRFLLHNSYPITPVFAACIMGEAFIHITSKSFVLANIICQTNKLENQLRYQRNNSSLSKWYIFHQIYWLCGKIYITKFNNSWWYIRSNRADHLWQL